jgi:hypothetical protein
MKSLDSIRKEWRKSLPPPRIPQPPPKKGKKKTSHGHKEEKQLELALEEGRPAVESRRSRKRKKRSVRHVARTR